MNARSYIAILLILAATLVAVGTAGAEAEAPPQVSIATGPLDTGYNWASHADATHVVTSALPLYSVIDASEFTTPRLDVEFTDLMPWRSYDLVLGPLKRAVYADGSGHGVAWNVLNEPAAWTLIDRRSGEPVTIVTVTPSLLRPQTEDCTDQWPCCHPTCQITIVSSDPIQQDTSDGLVLEQGAYSFTDSATVTVNGCWDHSISVEAKASGGIAAYETSAGVTLTYEDGDCIEISAHGQPREFRRSNQFRQDWYEDGSNKIYSIGKSAFVASMLSDISYAPPDEALTVYVDPGDPTIFSRHESKDLGVRFSHGVRVFSNSLGVSIFSRTTGESSMSIKLDPVEPTLYKIWFVTETEDNRGALIAMAWRID